MGNHEGYVVLIKKPNDPRLYGPVEHSFSIAVQVNETQYWWGAKDYWGPGKHIDAMQRAMDSVAYWKKEYPNWEYKIWDLKDPMLPILIDWALYEDAGQTADTLSGLKDKYHRRNLSFAVKSAHDIAASVMKKTLQVIEDRDV